MSDDVNMNLDALEKLNRAFNYADEMKRTSPIGENTVLYLENGERLSCRYSPDDRPKDLLHFRRTRTEMQKQLNNETRALFKQMVIDIFGTSIDDVPKSVRSAMELGKFDDTGRPLTTRRVLAVNKAILSAMKGVNRMMGLSGAAAGKIATIVANGSEILSAEDPANELQTRCNRHAKSQFATLIAKEIGVNLQGVSRIDADTGKLIVDQVEMQFDKDLVRNENVTLKGKKLSVGYNQSRDELVQFLTGQKRATFEDADNQTKLKACILMAVIQQGTFGCATSAVGHAFSPQGMAHRLTPGRNRFNGGKMFQDFALTKDKFGNIGFSAKVKFTGPVQLGMMNKAGDWFTKMTDAKESYVEYKLDTKISADELEKLATADWSNFDATEIDRIENDYSIPERFAAAANLIPDQFRFTGDVKVSCRIHAQELNDIQ